MRHHPKALAGRSILIIEDEQLVALDVRDAFSAAGASIISASNAAEALRLIGSPGVAAAVVDINLGDEDCSNVCQRLSEVGIPFVFYTGEARPEILKRWPSAPVLTKLASKERVVEVVAGLSR
jgi:CheY-like chemotaxis protein